MSNARSSIFNLQFFNTIDVALQINYRFFKKRKII